GRGQQALSKPIGDGNGGGGGALGRSISLRYGGNKATIDERRRPSLSAGAGAGGAGASAGGGGAKTANRRSIMLTSFVPPVGLSGGPNSSSSTRSSNDSGRNALGSCDSSASSSASASLAEPAALTSIRLRPPSADIIAAPQQQQQPSVIKSALASISERAGGEEAGGGGGPPAWVLEVQRRKREALDRKDEDRKDQDRKDEDRRDENDDDELPPLAEIDLSPVVKENTPPPPAPASPRAYVAPTRASASVYRSLSASLGIGQPVTAPSPNPAQDGERQRSTSQASAVASPNPAQPSSGGGLFAAVSSFFGRASTQGSATESAHQMSAMAARLSSQSSSGNKPEGNNIAFPGMRPSHSEAVAENDDDDDSRLLLHQLEAQNAQILGDNKARVFADKATDKAEAVSADDESADWDFWGSLISDYDRVSRASPRKLARAVHAGIPAPIRGTVWQLMSGSRAEAAVVGAVFRRLQQHHEGDSNSDQQKRNEKLIRQDVARTFPRDAFFRDAGGAGQAALFSVLRAYSLYDAEVGYCQGLADANQITAVTPRLLQTLRRRYVEETERRLDEEDEAARVKDEAARLKAECEALRRENQQLQNKLKDLPAAPAQPPPVRGVDELAQKNVQLAIKNQQLEDSLHDMEAALVQIKVLYAESESDRAVLAMKLDGLRKALT
ncbi:GTPase-activating protein, partial [Coemansia sp. RSA 1694]